jgi:hypothetical protein
MHDRREVLVTREVNRKDGRHYHKVMERHPTIKEVTFMIGANMKGKKVPLEDPAYAKSKHPDWLHTLPEVKKRIAADRAEKERVTKMKNEMFLEGAKQSNG